MVLLLGIVFCGCESSVASVVLFVVWYLLCCLSSLLLFHCLIIVRLFLISLLFFYFSINALLVQGLSNASINIPSEIDWEVSVWSHVGLVLRTNRINREVNHTARFLLLGGLHTLVDDG